MVTHRQCGDSNTRDYIELSSMFFALFVFRGVEFGVGGQDEKQRA
jgi:hypothetical protein